MGSTVKSPIAKLSAALDYDWAESMLADGDVSLDEIYSTATKLQTVAEDIAESTTENYTSCPETLRVPVSSTRIGGCSKTVVAVEEK